MRERARTRRAFIGAAAATGAGGVLAGPLVSPLLAETAPDPHCLPTPPGIPTAAIAATPDGRTIWSTDSHADTITAHRLPKLARRHSIRVGGAPLGIDVTPDGRFALVTTAFYDRPGLAIVDLRGREVDRVDVGPEPRAIVATGRSAWIAGAGAEGTLTRVDIRSGHLHEPIALGAHPRGLALTADGSHALVALNGDSALALGTLGRRPRVQRIKTAAFPHELAIAPDGSRAFVTHNGFGDDRVSVVDLADREVSHRVKVGADPGGVTFSRSGATALVACSAGGRAVLLDGRSGHVLRRLRIGGHPRTVALAGTTVVVADAITGALQTVRIGALS